jgi:Domain of unknown function (DUF4184)
MPFTFSHPAIVLPAKFLPNRLFSMTGLLVGSTAPDFEYFIRMNVQSIYSHTVAGIFYFDLPVGLALCFIFHNIVRNEFIDHLPAFIRSRFLNLKSFNWNQIFKKTWFVVSLSIIVGAASHIFWDSFTHETGYFVSKIPFLRQQIQFARLQIPVYNIMQHLSSLVGFLIISIFVWEMPETKNDHLTRKPNYWIYVFGITAAVILAKLIIGFNFVNYGTVILTAISAFLIGITLTPFLLKKITKNVAH